MFCATFTRHSKTATLLEVHLALSLIVYGQFTISLRHVCINPHLHQQLNIRLCPSADAEKACGRVRICTSMTRVPRPCFTSGPAMPRGPLLSSCHPNLFRSCYMHDCQALFAIWLFEGCSSMDIPGRRYGPMRCDDDDDIWL